MNTHRRLLTVVLITLSCLFAIQPAGATNAQTTGTNEGSCTNIGPTMFQLGLGSSAAVMSVPACYTLDAGTSDEAKVVQVPIEGSLMVSNEPPAFVIAAEHDMAVDVDASATSDEPDLLRGQPSNIGPTI